MHDLKKIALGSFVEQVRYYERRWEGDWAAVSCLLGCLESEALVASRSNERILVNP